MDLKVIPIGEETLVQSSDDIAHSKAMDDFKKLLSDTLDEIGDAAGSCASDREKLAWLQNSDYDDPYYNLLEAMLELNILCRSTSQVLEATVGKDGLWCSVAGGELLGFFNSDEEAFNAIEGLNQLVPGAITWKVSSSA